ncbi:hypothetical protein EDB19DRAFT_1678900 [Suillus lakei]|nr:hypothetical protein EDB19DRAFT_1678900 [Suillus lakei]
MSSKAYLVPVDPKNPAGIAAPGVNPVTLWSSLPQPQKPAKVARPTSSMGLPHSMSPRLCHLGRGFTVRLVI